MQVQANNETSLRSDFQNLGEDIKILFRNSYDSALARVQELELNLEDKLGALKDLSREQLEAARDTLNKQLEEMNASITSIEEQLSDSYNDFDMKIRIAIQDRLENLKGKVNEFQKALDS